MLHYDSKKIRWQDTQERYGIARIMPRNVVIHAMLLPSHLPGKKSYRRAYIFPCIQPGIRVLCHPSDVLDQILTSSIG
jgi:hypothetical protein